MSTAANLRTRLEAAATAIEAGDYATALTKARAAQATLLAIPDGARAGMQVQYGRQIQELIDECKKALATQNLTTAGGMQTQKVKYVRDAQT